jgi:protein-arginine kinase activator protein McsA
MAPKKKRVKMVKCKPCAKEFNPQTELTPEKTWNVFSPMPDKKGRITITQMATFRCPDCGKILRGSLGSRKADVPEGYRTHKQIVTDSITSGEKFNLDELAEEMGVQIENLTKVIQTLIKKGEAKGQLKGSDFIPN